MDDTNPEDYSAPRTPGQAEGTEDDMTGEGHGAEEDARRSPPSQAEGEEEA